MSGWKQTFRAGADRLVKPYTDPVTAELASLSQQMASTGERLDGRLEGLDGRLDGVDGRLQAGDARLEAVGAEVLSRALDEAAGSAAKLSDQVERFNADMVEIRERLGQVEAHGRAYADEVRGLRESSDTRLDLTNLRMQQILDEVGGVRDRFERLERRFGEVEASLVHQLEGQAKRQAELRSGFGDMGASIKKSLEKLELLMMGQLEGLFGAVHDETASLRADIVELTRMLRMQGDAADQVAEVMGRTFTRLSAEVASLSEAVRELKVGAERATSA